MLTEVSRVDRSQVRGENQEDVVTGHRTPLEVRRHNKIMGKRSEHRGSSGSPRYGRYDGLRKWCFPASAPPHTSLLLPHHLNISSIVTSSRKPSLTS